MQIANDFPISLPPDEAYRLLLGLDGVAAAPASPANDNDLRAGKLMLAVLRSWVARLTRSGRKGHTR